MLAWYLVFAAVFTTATRVTAQDAASAERSYQAAIEKANKDRSAAIALAATEYARALKEVVAAETKKGNLDAALAARDKLKAVEARGDGGIALAAAEYARAIREVVAAETKKGDLDAALAARNKLKAVEALGDDGSLLAKLVGTNWVTDKGSTFVWKTDGTFLHKGGVRPCVAVDATRVVIFFDNKRVDLLEFDTKLSRFEHWLLSSDGKPLESVKRVSK